MDAEALRAEFPLLRRAAFLNAGTAGPVPARAADAVADAARRAAEEGRFGPYFDRLMEARERQRAAYAARLGGVPPEDVALTTSTTDGIAIALAGLDLRPGDEVITSDEEHPGVLGPLAAQRRARGIEIRVVRLEDVPDAVGPRTRAVAVSHVSWIRGAVAPAALADLDVPVVLDGAQGVGAVAVDAPALGCAAYAGSGQKWLCGPLGTGMLWVSPAMRERIASTRPGWSAYAEHGGGLDAPLHADGRRYDSPAPSLEEALAAVAAHDVLDAAGWPAIHARATSLAARLADALRDRGREVLPRGDTTLVSWRHHVDDAAAARDRLAARGVIVRDLPGRGLLRASVGAWNDERDLERLLEAL